MARLSLVGGTIVTLDAAGTIVPDGTLVIEDGLVVDIVADRTKAGTSIDCSGRLVIPGLINAHAHLGESLFRGAGGELGLIRWIRERSHPLMTSLDAAGFGAAVRLAGMEMLRGGTTAFLDPEVPPRWQRSAAEAAAQTGLRATLALAVEGTAGYGEDAHGHGHDHGHESEHGHEPERGHDHTSTADGSDDPVALLASAPDVDGVRFWIGPRVLSSVTPELGAGVSQAAKDGAGITFHCAEAPEDVADVAARTDRGPADFARSLGLLGPSSVIAHGVYLDDADLDILGETGTSVAHCPTSNAKLGNGIAPVVEMIDRDINVALGTDGALCNDTYDLVAEMRQAALFQKAVRRDAAALSAEHVLRMATLGGARALGLDAGRLEAGSAGDCVVLEPRSDGMWPSVDAIDSLVFGNARTAVRTVVIGGEIRVDEGHVSGMDEADVHRDAEEAAGAAIERSGIGGDIVPDWMGSISPWLGR